MGNKYPQYGKALLTQTNKSLEVLTHFQDILKIADNKGKAITLVMVRAAIWALFQLLWRALGYGQAVSTL